MKEVHGCRTILVVEDNDTISETLKDLLELEGYHVILAKNGREALTAIDNALRPCLILLDMFMPIMDGWEFLDQLKLKEGDLITSLPIVVTSAAGERAEEASKLVRGFIKKPVDLNVLLKTVETFCNCSAASRSAR